MFGQQPNKAPVPNAPNFGQVNAFGQAQPTIPGQSTMFGSSKVIQNGSGFGMAQPPGGVAQQGAHSTSFDQMQQQTQNAGHFAPGTVPQQGQPIRAAFGDFGTSPTTDSTSLSLGPQGFPSPFAQIQQHRQSSSTVVTPSGGYQQTHRALQPGPFAGLQNPMSNGLVGGVAGMQSMTPGFNGFGTTSTPTAMSSPQTFNGLAHHTNPYNLGQLLQQQPQQLSGTFSPDDQNQQMLQSFLLSQQISNSLHGTIGSHTMNPAFNGMGVGAATSTPSVATGGSLFGVPNTSTGTNAFGGVPSTLTGNMVGGPDGSFFIPVGTTVPFRPLNSIDTMLRNGMNHPTQILYQCISCMKEYETKSLEELRVEDYLANRKQGVYGSSGVFSMPSNSNSLLTQNQSPITFGAPSTPSVPSFGQLGAPSVSTSASRLPSPFCSTSSPPSGFTPTTPFGGGFNTVQRQTSTPASRPFGPTANPATSISTPLRAPVSTYRSGVSLRGGSGIQSAHTLAPPPGPLNPLFSRAPTAQESDVNASPFSMAPALSGTTLQSNPAALSSTPFGGVGSPGSTTFGPNSAQYK